MRHARVAATAQASAAAKLAAAIQSVGSEGSAKLKTYPRAQARREPEWPAVAFGQSRFGQYGKRMGIAQACQTGGQNARRANGRKRSYPTGFCLLEASMHHGRKRRPLPKDSMAQDSKPVLRFAPSPTGYLHIGGARTALFNWLYAKRHGGTFLLRIEDTDRERSTPEAVDAILKGMEWLGLTWDGQAVYQAQRAARHREVAEQLLAAGKAYRCYATAAELDQMRGQQRAQGKPDSL